MAKLKIELDTDDYKSENEIYESIIRGLQEAIEINNDKNEKKSKRWKPELDEEYYFVDSDNKVEEDVWSNDYETDKGRLKMRNVFKTEEEAKFEAERRKVIAK